MVIVIVIVVAFHDCVLFSSVVYLPFIRSVVDFASCTVGQLCFKLGMNMLNYFQLNNQKIVFLIFLTTGDAHNF